MADVGIGNWELEIGNNGKLGIGDCISIRIPKSCKLTFKFQISQSQIFDSSILNTSQSSILNPRSSILDPQTSILDSPFSILDHRTSFVSQRNHRIDFHCAASRKIARKQRHTRKQQRDARERQRVSRANAE
jgi:hypothetical protein